MVTSFSAEEMASQTMTVKQHGFVVKGSASAAFPPRTPPSGQCLQESERQEISDGSSLISGSTSGLTRESLGLRDVPQSSSVPSVSNVVPCSVSPGLPRVGDVRLAEYTHLTPGVKRLMRSVMRGLKAHQEPEAATEGLGGTYFFRNEAGVKIAIMKPCDEEPLAPNNPKGFVGRNLGEPGLKPTVRVGEAASREVAAYLLDHDHFAKVPHTVMVRMAHPVFHEAENGEAEDGEDVVNLGKDCENDMISTEDDKTADGLPLKLGSLQEFVPHECDTSEMGASKFTARDVQRIGILDVRLFNTDRHAGNILIRRARLSSVNSRSNDCPDACLAKDQYELIPIDHGFALPEALEPPYFEWQHWPQAMLPFGQEELEYIRRLDPKADAELLRRELPSLKEESLRLLEVSTTILKQCAAAGLSLSEIATVISRPLVGLEDEPSALEKICEEIRTEVEQEIAAQAAELELKFEDSDIEEDNCAEKNKYFEVHFVDEASDGDIADDEQSPSADSANTQFAMHASGMGSDASRQTVSMDEVLFTMDEDGARTPAAGSPRTAADMSANDLNGGRLRVKTGLSTPTYPLNAPSLVIKRSGEIATPGAIVGMSFGTALASTMDSLSLPPSLDSHENSPTQDGNDSSSTAELSFNGASTYVPRRGFVKAAGQIFTNTSKPEKKSKSKRRHGHRRRLRKSSAGVYPPLVEPRGAGASVFSGLNEDQWHMFMYKLQKRIDQAISKGEWTFSNSNSSAAPQMSCPKF